MVSSVEASRFVRALPDEVERALTPAAVVEYEGSFEVRAVEERDEGWVVTAGGTGVEFPLRFERREAGLYYEQAGDAGPLERMETTLSLAPEDEGTRITARSSVAGGTPLSPLTDRLVAWKRKGELKRALRAMDDDLS